MEEGPGFRYFRDPSSCGRFEVLLRNFNRLATEFAILVKEGEWLAAAHGLMAKLHVDNLRLAIGLHPELFFSISPTLDCHARREAIWKQLDNFQLFLELWPNAQEVNQLFCPPALT